MFLNLGDNMQNNKIAFKVSVTTIIFNVFLAILKIFAGIVANSEAMISDAIHTLSDIFTTIIAVVGVIISNKEAKFLDFKLLENNKASSIFLILITESSNFDSKKVIKSKE